MRLLLATILVIGGTIQGKEAMSDVGISPGSPPAGQDLKAIVSPWETIKVQADRLIKQGNVGGGGVACPSSLLASQGNNVAKCFPNIPLPPSSIKGTGGGGPMEGERLLVFVSFSMPEASLKRLAQEAEKYQAILVIRGLHQGSIVKTAQKAQMLSMAVDIHPELFEFHNITAVPTFIKFQNGHPLYRLKGNVTLGFAVEKFEGQRLKEAQ